MAQPTPRARARSLRLGGLTRLDGLKVAALGALLALTSCGGSGGGGSAPGGAGTNSNGNAELVAVRFGRNAQILGYRAAGNGFVIETVATDVLIGPDIQDERPPGSTRRDSEILYDFLQADLATLTPRVLIPREIGSPEFVDAFNALDDRALRITPAIFGDDTNAQPFTVVPRNAAIELEFSESLGITEDFFVVRNQNGNITGQRNTEAVQLLEIRGDPNDNSPSGDFRVINARFVPNGNRLLIDPILLGVEGPDLQLRNNAAGLPESPDQIGANIRIAISLEGPLAIPGIFQPENSRFTGLNNTVERSVIRDFRSGNRSDSGADIARGFVRDPEPPRLVGEIVMRLARVDQPSASQQTITVFKNGVIHELDLGDGIRINDPTSGALIGQSEIVSEPTDDASDPAVQSVRARINPIAGLESVDPQNDPNFPLSDPAAQAAFLAANAPIVVLVAEYNSVRASRLSNPMLPPGDDIANFVRFSPASLPNADGSPSLPNENVSPFAEAIIRFTKPVDLSTVRAYDSFFFAARNVIDEDLIQNDFTLPRGIDFAEFNLDKFATPHLVAARVIDEDGSQTRVRLQPQKGFYLDDAMRQADAAAIAALPMGETLAPADRPFPYYVHLVSGQEGIRDLTGNPVDFNAESGIVDFEVLPFAIDTRVDAQGRPIFADNQVVSVVSRFENEDEDARPSVFRYADDEMPLAGATMTPASSQPYNDVFGDVTYLADGRLLGRTSSRFRRVVDNLNQSAGPPQGTFLQFCPNLSGDFFTGSGTTATAPPSPTGSTPFGQGIQNPLNPAGARLQTVWREIDMSLSRLNATDFDLDVEQMYWAPFQGTPISFDEFDSVSLFLGHSEFRPNPCIGDFSALPVLVNSGIGVIFDENYVRNRLPGVNQTEEREQGHPAYVDSVLTIQAADAVLEPNQVNRFLPLPDFQEPFFVWRDQTMMLQGGNQQKGNDAVTGNNGNSNLALRPFIPTPWLGGFGTAFVDGMNNTTQRATVVWDSSNNFRLSNNGSSAERFTDGLVGSIALPLLADFQTACDDPELPAGGGFIATGFNGWQIAIAVQSDPGPFFRAFSGGFIGNAQNPPICVAPGSPRFSRASSGFTPTGGSSGPSRDNSVYWIMADFARRQTVATFGFVDILDPHRRTQGPVGAQTAPVAIDEDPRLGPFFFNGALGQSVLPTTLTPQYDFAFEPPLSSLPGGTSIVPEFRGASRVSDLPWRWDRKRTTLNFYGLGNQPQPSAVNFPNDPLKACDAHIRKYDDRTLPNLAQRNFWTYYYNDTVTDYTTNIFDLSSTPFLAQFAGPNEDFGVDDVRYVNWRFIMSNNINSDPPVSPTIESFAISYRFENR